MTDPYVDAAARAGLPVAPRVFDEVESTMGPAREWADEGAPHGAWVAARAQRRGRGRLERAWETPPGAVALTAILRPRLALGDVGLVALAAAVAARATCGPRYGIKWPNDLLGPDGRKVAGVLAELELRERRVAYVLVGVGLNVEQAPTGLPHAACLADYDPAPRRPEHVAAALIGHLLDAIGLAERDPGALLDAWREGAVTVGRRVRVGGAEGVATGVTTEGALIVATDDGAALIAHSGDVLHLDP